MAQSHTRPNPPATFFKPLSEYRDPYYFRRDVFRQRRRLLLLFAAPGLLVFTTLWVMVLASKHHRIFQAAPVAVAHRAFNNDCASCHSASFRPVERLINSDIGVRSVDDQACLRCHDGPIHHAAQLGVAACAICHREHRGQSELARVEDAHCTACHASLAAHTDCRKKDPALRTFRNASAFTAIDHPEFALWATPRDPGLLRFSHQSHMDKKGVPVTDKRKRVVLRCANCHQPDAERRYMQPIRYELHCAECHPLSGSMTVDLGAKPFREIAARFRATPAPHPKPGESAATVRAVLRDRYLEFVRDHPEVLKVAEGVAPVRPIPGRRPRVRLPLTTEWEWAGHQLVQAERLLFDGAQGCRYCHREAARQADGLPVYAPPAILARWLPNSTFSHDSHRALDCQQCHAGAKTSSGSADVLMPKMATCISCHTPDGAGARADCVECHRYHDRARERDPNPLLSIDAFLGVRKSASSPEDSKAQAGP